MNMLFQAIWGVLVSAQLVYLAPTDQQSLEAVCIDQACYTISWSSKRYQGASRTCAKLGGQLMTVRSTVEADAISILMDKAERNNSTVWIGLEHPYNDRCTDTSQILRGFHWITGDNNTDYANWKTGEEMCGPRCVSVHSDRSWEAKDCNSKVDGYVCEFSYIRTCAALYPPDGYSVTYQIPFAVSHGDFTMLPPNTNAFLSNGHDPLICVEDKGNGNMKWSSEKPGPWTCLVENGGCEYICMGDNGNPKCMCSPETHLTGDGRSCSPPPTPSPQPNPCEPNPCAQHCIAETPSEFTCMCDEGYIIAEDQKRCQDVDDCVTFPNICEHQCTNTVGSFVCSCHSGFELVDGRCVDIDECDDPRILCEHNCDNYPGGYTCTCYSRYILDEKHHGKCKLFCDTPVCDAECDPHNTRKNCNCPEGFILDLDDTVCIDVDECESMHCEHLCTNFPGTFQCYCQDGFILQDDTSCVLDEGSGGKDVSPETPSSSTTPPQVHILQPAMLLGISVGILSMLTVLIGIICHMVRKHNIDHAAMDYKCKTSEKDVVLQQVKSAPQQEL
ncbi:hypothetical protein FKM82_010352 [Ascaphus truei]